MTRGISAGLNAFIGKWLPEQRMFAKTDDRTRFVRLSPLVQVTGIAALLAVTSWSGYLTINQLAAAKVDAQLVQADHKLTNIYETRIARLEADKRRLADRLSETRAKMTFVAKEVSETHSNLGAALATSTSLKATQSSHREQLTEMAALQVATTAHCDALNAKLTGATTDLGLLKQRLTASDDAMTDLVATLETIASDRDVAQTKATDLTKEVAALQTAYDTRREQQTRLVSRLEDAARLSLGSLETVFSESGVDLDNVLAEARRKYSGSGGLFTPIASDVGFDKDDTEGQRVKTLFSDMERINTMRIAVEQLPFLRPVGPARFSSGYGPRKDPKNGRKAFHAGIDLAGPHGTAIFAAGSGEVVFSARQRGFGNLIKIRHAFGYETVYAHLNRRRVKAGDKVERGDRIGDMGNTGRSTGTHLHYEIRVNGNTVNPAKYIEAARNVL